jgi:hypothetical protein
MPQLQPMMFQPGGSSSHASNRAPLKTRADRNDIGVKVTGQSILNKNGVPAVYIGHK